MSFQLKSIVLYNKKGMVRSVSLRPGELNIITGASKTGKTALIAIIEYCFGADECEIPEGIIRRTLSWVGIHLALDEGEAFVGRRLPDPGYKSSSDVFYTTGRQIEIPPFGLLCSTTNAKGLEGLLSGHAGIGENLHEPPEGQTRRPLTANIRHALTYCFQHQTEIDSNRHLFHKQTEQYIPQAIKDTIPVLLGAVTEDHVAKMAELRRLRQELKGLEHQLAEHAAIQGTGVSRAQSLLTEATDFGLCAKIQDASRFQEYVEALRLITANPLPSEEEEILSEGGELERLQTERISLTEEIQAARDQMDSLKALLSGGEGYSHEVSAQLIRLRSIDVFEQPDTKGALSCPLCQSILREEQIPPSLEQVKHSVGVLQDQVRKVEERSPQMQAIITEYQQRIADLQNKLKDNRTLIETIQASNMRLQESIDRGARRAHILGRIGLFLESLPPLEDDSALKKNIESLREKIEILEQEMGNDAIQERLQSILSLISRDMNVWAQDLGLEHSNLPLRLDLNKLTVVADGADGPIPMNRMGSGENWVGYHLIAHLALHHWFVSRGRPIPRFLFIDQPSQVYFPEDGDWDSRTDSKGGQDRDAVSHMYRLMLNVIQELGGKLQIVVTDHANISESWFQKSIVERWREGKALIPDDWDV